MAVAGPIDRFGLTGAPAAQSAPQADLMGERLAREAQAASPLFQAVGDDAATLTPARIRAIQDVARERAETQRQAESLRAVKPKAAPVKDIVARPPPEPKQTRLLSEQEWVAQNYPAAVQNRRIPKGMNARIHEAYRTYANNTLALMRLAGQGAGRTRIPANIEGQIGYAILTKQSEAVQSALWDVLKQRYGEEEAQKVGEDVRKKLETEAVGELRGQGKSAYETYQRMKAPSAFGEQPVSKQAYETVMEVWQSRVRNDPFDGWVKSFDEFWRTQNGLAPADKALMESYLSRTQPTRDEVFLAERKKRITPQQKLRIFEFILSPDERQRAVDAALERMKRGK